MHLAGKICWGQMPPSQNLPTWRARAPSSGSTEQPAPMQQLPEGTNTSMWQHKSWMIMMESQESSLSLSVPPADGPCTHESCIWWPCLVAVLLAEAGRSRPSPAWPASVLHPEVQQLDLHLPLLQTEEHQSITQSISLSVDLSVCPPVYYTKKWLCELDCVLQTYFCLTEACTKNNSDMTW